MPLFMVSAPSRPRCFKPSAAACAVAALAAASVLLPTASANADTLLARANIAPGSLTVAAGRPAADPADPRRLLLPLEVVDARGDGAGWSVFLSASGSHGPLPDVAALEAPTVSCATDSDCTLPASTLSYPLEVPLTGVALKVLNAAPATGMGAQVTTLGLDDGEIAGQTVNATVTVASGP